MGQRKPHFLLLQADFDRQIKDDFSLSFSCFLKSCFESSARLMVLKLFAPWTVVFSKLENVKSWQSILNSWEIKLMNRIFCI